MPNFVSECLGADRADRCDREVDAGLKTVNVLLISTYELGRQPFGLASPAAWLRRDGAEVACLDLSLQELDEAAVRSADLIAFFLPMHTATRLALAVLKQVRRLNPRASLCAYGLYAPVNAGLLRELGVRSIVGGEFEEGLVDLVRRLNRPERDRESVEQGAPIISLARQKFVTPDRTGLPTLKKYARLVLPDGTRRTVGYTEASRGCKHLCRHCPVVPVYNGNFRIIQQDAVMEDIRRQVEAGAEHMTFGDPDFFNGIRHAAEIIRRLHWEFPQLTYDVTIKVEHLLKHAEYLPLLRQTGCAFVTTAVESVDDRVLQIFAKNHTRADFIRLVALFREVGLVLAPTFVAFNPWTSLEGYEDLMATVAELGLVEHVAPIQLAIRLLIPAGSRLLELPEVQGLVGGFDEEALTYHWEHPDPRVDALQQDLEIMVQRMAAGRCYRSTVFAEVWRRLQAAKDSAPRPLPAVPPGRLPTTIPYLTEPWYC